MKALPTAGVRQSFGGIHQQRPSGLLLFRHSASGIFIYNDHSRKSERQREKIKGEAFQEIHFVCVLNASL
ncbi:hypothetical protein [uncultured Pontibacter sp.]|uniref:hypothetical protein n=1 Tax=uncultured Pontibacter sp. TaxID=453356 RepID=UPI002634B077|nr:hypothetical protein [uncultured Pontibacter sp.]